MGLWSVFTLKAPSLFLSTAESFTSLSTVFQSARLRQLEQSFDRLVNYTADLSLNPSVFIKTVKGIGTGIGSVVSGAGKALSSLGHLVAGFLKAPIQYLINIAITIGVTALLLFLTWKLMVCQLHRYKRKRPQNRHKKQDEEDGCELKTFCASTEDDVPTPLQLSTNATVGYQHHFRHITEL